MEARSSSADRTSTARSEAGKRGARTVKAAFGAAVTRRRLAELVGASPSTIKRWEGLGVIRPKFDVILGSTTAVFEPEDVAFAQRLIVLLRDKNGEITVQDAAAEVRGKGGGGRNERHTGDVERGTDASPSDTVTSP